MKQNHTPYRRALESYAASETRRFHLPGHMGGRWGAEELSYRSDTTAVLDLDDIHYPSGPLGKAQRLAAKVYGSLRTWFLINGSTGGVQVMALSALREGDTAIVPRNSHRSIHGALLLCGARPVYAATPYDEFLGVHHCLEVDELERLLEAHPEAKACLCESLNMYGAAADVRGLVQTAHRHGVALLVDEAWGAHLIASPLLPESACSAGADLVVQSAHKTLSALGQAAWMHRCGELVEEQRIIANLRLLQSSSPSSLLLASLEGARRLLDERGREEWERTLALAQLARQRIASESGLRCPLPQAAHACDLTRLVISGRGCGCDGQLLECRLRYRHNIQVDLSDLYQALLSFTPAHDEGDVDILVAALREVAEAGRGVMDEVDIPRVPAWGESELTPREAWQAEREAVPLEAALGRLSAERVTAYPPGMPVLCPGERIGAEQLEYLRQVKELDLPLEGLAGDSALYCVK